MNSNELISKDISLAETLEAKIEESQTEIDQLPDPFVNMKPWVIDSDIPDISFSKLINQVLQTVNLRDKIAKIKKGTEYVVQVPLKFKEAVQSGELFIVQNQKTGELRPQLARIGKNGRHEFVAPLEMIKKEVVQGNPLQSIADGYHNIALQKQLAQLSVLMEETNQVVQRIEQGQHDDRLGLLMAGRNEIVLALKDINSINEAELNSGRNNLQVGCAQVLQTVIRRTSEFPKIPKSRLVRDLKEFRRKGYFRSLDEKYNQIQDCFEFYLQGVKMIAGSYAVCGELDKANMVFDQAKLAIQQIDFSKVSRMALLHPKEEEWIWKDTAKFIEFEHIRCLEEAKHFDMLTLKVSGEQLLEALENGRAEGIQEEKTQ